MSKHTHHWRKAGIPIHMDTHGQPTRQEEEAAAAYFRDGAPLNRAMRRHKARAMRRAAGSKS